MTTDVNKLILKNTSIDTLKMLDKEVAKVRARILIANDQKVGYIAVDDKGKEEVKYTILDYKFCKTLMDRYNKRLKRKWGIGKVKYPPICVEHIYKSDNTVGHLNSTMEFEKAIIDGKAMDTLVVDFIIVDGYVIKDLVDKGRKSKFSSLSVGVDMEDPEQPDLYEVSLVEEPRVEQAMLLSKGVPAQQVDEKLPDIRKALKEEEQKEKRNLELKANKVIEKHFSQNRINRQQGNLILSRLKNSLSEDSIEAIDASLETLPKNKLVLASTIVADN